jgi:hypothetical protein
VTLLRRELETAWPARRIVESLWNNPARLARAPGGLQESVERLRRELRPELARPDWEPVLRRRRIAEERLASVERYAARRHCRRARMLEYFGEAAPPCGNCDACRP